MLLIFSLFNFDKNLFLQIIMYNFANIYKNRQMECIKLRNQRIFLEFENNNVILTIKKLTAKKKIIYERYNIGADVFFKSIENIKDGILVNYEELQRITGLSYASLTKIRFDYKIKPVKKLRKCKYFKLNDFKKIIKL